MLKVAYYILVFNLLFIHYALYVNNLQCYKQVQNYFKTQNPLQNNEFASISRFSNPFIKQIESCEHIKK